MDRIDITIYVGEVQHEKLFSKSVDAISKVLKEKIIQAQLYSKQRNAPFLKTTNSELTTREITESAMLSSEAKNLLNETAKKLGLSGRAYYRTLKVARTIADVEQSISIEKEHLLEALQYRSTSEN